MRRRNEYEEHWHSVQQGMHQSKSDSQHGYDFSPEPQRKDTSVWGALVVVIGIFALSYAAWIVL